MAGIVAFLVMVTVIVIVIIRNRKLNQNGCGETHISFSADIDQQVSFNSDEDSYTEKSKSYKMIILKHEFPYLNILCIIHGKNISPTFFL